MAKIKVILTETVAGQGKKGEIINVSEGYAKNFLLKNKKAVLATDDELKKLENKNKKAAKQAEEEKAKAEDMKKVLESKVIKMKVKAGEGGKIFGSVTSKEIAAAIEEEFSIKIDKKKIDSNIKTLGEHTAVVKLHKDVKAEVKIITEA